MSYLKKYEFSKLKVLFKKFARRRFVKYGIPFVLLMVGSSFGVKQFAQLRYEYSTKVTLKPEDAAKLTEMKKPEKVTLESEYDKIKNLDIDNWVNIRGPRPWEEPVQQQQANKT